MIFCCEKCTHGKEELEAISHIIIVSLSNHRDNILPETFSLDIAIVNIIIRKSSTFKICRYFVMSNKTNILIYHKKVSPLVHIPIGINKVETIYMHCILCNRCCLIANDPMKNRAKQIVKKYVHTNQKFKSTAFQWNGDNVLLWHVIPLCWVYNTLCDNHVF